MWCGRPGTQLSITPVHKRRVHRGAPVLASFLLLILLANTLAGCGANSAVAVLSGPADAAGSSAAASSLTATSPTPTPPPTWTALPTTPAVAYAARAQHTATEGVLPESTTTSTPSATPTATPIDTSAIVGAPTVLPSPSVAPTTSRTAPLPLFILLVAMTAALILAGGITCSRSYR